MRWSISKKHGVTAPGPASFGFLTRSTHHAEYSVPGSIPGLTSSNFASVASNFSRNSPTIRGGGKNKKSKFSATYGIRTHA